MAVTNLKRAALDALAAYLAGRVTALADRVHGGQADSEPKPTFPYVEMLPDPMNFTPFREETLDESVDNKITLDVGSYDGPVEIRLGASSLPEREDLEARLLDCFFQREDAPGVVVLPLGTITLPGGVPAYQPTVTFVLTEAEWVEEKVFDRKRFSSLMVDMALPVLVMRDVVGDIDTLVIALTSDMTSPGATVTTTQVAVADDGTITNV